MADRMLNFESLLLDVVEAVQSGKRSDVLDAPAMRRMQLAQQRQLQQDQEAQHGELERLLEAADRDRADRGGDDDEIDAGNNVFNHCAFEGLLQYLQPRQPSLLRLQSCT